MPLRGRTLALYFAAWAPYAVVTTLALLVQRPDIPQAAAVWAGVFAATVASVMGLVLRAMVQRAFAKEWALPLRASAFTLGALVFGAGLMLTNLAGMQSERAAHALQAYLANAIVWDFLSNSTVGALVITFFAYAETMRRLREQRVLAERAEALRVRAELEALRAQLDPHFLFNTLHTITSLVRSDAAGAQDALERFAVLMRYVLDAERARGDEVPLEEELRFVRSYIGLEKLRLGTRLVVVEEIDDEALECLLPRLTLQPLVENAIRHGIAPREQGATLRIAARVEGTQLLLEIADDGQGGDAEAVERGGVGFTVVRQRLAARHGTAASMRVTAAAGEGWRVFVRLPAVVGAAARPRAPGASISTARGTGPR